MSLKSSKKMTRIGPNQIRWEGKNSRSSLATNTTTSTRPSLAATLRFRIAQIPRDSQSSGILSRISNASYYR